MVLSTYYIYIYTKKCITIHICIYVYITKCISMHVYIEIARNVLPYVKLDDKTCRNVVSISSSVAHQLEEAVGFY